MNMQQARDKTTNVYPIFPKPCFNDSNTQSFWGLVCFDLDIAILKLQLRL